MEGKEYNVKLQRLDVLMDKLKITKREIIEMRLLASELEKYEDELDCSEMYETLFPLSKVDGVRLFPKEIEVRKECEWEYDEETDSYDTECDNKFTIIDGTPKENEMTFCPYCGARIKDVY